MKKFTLPCFSTFSLGAFVAQAFFVFALTLACTMHLQAQAPRISVQGTLKSASGTPASDGQQEITFRLYNVPTGGMPLWEETAIVDVVGGIYSHYLGSVTPLVPAHFAQTLYLGVKVGTYELVPRNQLAYAPYAFSVNVAQKVVCSGAVGDVKYSVLSPAEFVSRNGDCWVPMDGRALATGDSLRVIKGWTVLPDAGGLFLRSQEFSGGADNDPNRTSTTAIATVQQDEFESHNHTASNAGAHTHTVTDRHMNESSGSGEYPDGDGTGTSNTIRTTSSDGDHTHPISNTGALETRPKNLNLWVYIRIN
ncbi:MAG: hypothetical protein IPM98_11850 [Lewinellaceae bacterium]|nr:hypothetical protein [Lewinellaceae bacterium]